MATTPGGQLTQTTEVTARVVLTYNRSVVEWAPGRRNLPITAGSVRGSRTFVRRSLDLTLLEPDPILRQSLWTMLTKPGVELQAFRGVRYLDGTQDEWPIGVFLTRRPQMSTGGTMTLSGCPDIAQRVVRARFESPRSSRTGFSLPQQVQSLIGEVVPGFRFRDDIKNATAMPAAVWERDRAEAVAQVAIAAGGEVWADPSGVFVLGRPPTFAAKAKWRLTTKTGVISSAQVEVDWENAYNVVRADGERADGSAPFFAVVRDQDPASDTWAAGPMGPVPKFYASPLLTSTAACKRAAQTILFRSIGARKSLQVEAVANPTIDVADRVDVTLVDEQIHERHIIDTFDLPLFSAGMSFTTRAVNLVVDE